MRAEVLQRKIKKVQMWEGRVQAIAESSIPSLSPRVPRRNGSGFLRVSQAWRVKMVPLSSRSCQPKHSSMGDGGRPRRM